MVVEVKPLCRIALTQVLGSLPGLGEPIFVASLSEAARSLELWKPELLLVDLTSIEYDFGGLTRLISQHPSVRAIVIDDRSNPLVANLAKAAGAKGYACKTAEIAELRAAIMTAAAGREGPPADSPTQTAPGGAVRAEGRLSSRQLEVLECVAAGMGNQQIADKLSITLGTVKAHIHTILRLTGARNRTEAALFASRFSKSPPSR